MAITLLTLFTCLLLARRSNALTTTCTVREGPRDAVNGTLVCQVEPPRVEFEHNGIDPLRWRDRYAVSFAQSEAAYLKQRFHIAPNGSLYLVAPLDREDLCGALQLCCASEATCDIPLRLRLAGQGKLAMFSATVALIDVNDNAPKFGESFYEFELLESVPVGHQIPLKPATDTDSKEYNIERYDWNGKSLPGCPFELRVSRQNASSRLNAPIGEVYLITTAKLDRERTPSFEFILYAIDRGVPQLTGSTEIRITLLDVNDNAPQFARPLYTETIAENTLPSVTILRLTATDPDESINGDVEYSLRGDQNVVEKFAIDQFTGALHLIDALDFERQREYRFMIIATDRSLTSLTGQTQVMINVTNVNDAAPRIELELLSDQPDKQVVELSESTPIGTLVGLFQVQDEDSPSVQCALLSASKFRLMRSVANSTEFRIITTASFDRETSSVEHITIHCADQGDRVQLTGSATIRVDIIDENDCTPEFVHEPQPHLVMQNGVLLLQVTENNNAGDVLIDLKAVDRDEHSNSQLTYSLTADGVECCRIESDGRLVAARMFDREEQSAYRMRAEVCDGGKQPRCASLNLQLNVVDINDNAPSWKFATLALNVSEAAPNGTRVGVFEVRDSDAAENGEVELSGPFPISSNDYTDVRNTFRLVNRSLFIVKPLDRETIQTYYFVLTATDRGQQRLTSSATVTLQVADANDHSPVAEFRAVRNNTVRISYVDQPGTIVCELGVHDQDAGENARLMISIDEGNEFGLFDVKPSTKQAQRRDTEYVTVTVAKPLSRSHVGNHSMRIVVRDYGIPPRSVTVPLTVIVESGEAREKPSSRLPFENEDAQRALNELLWTKPVLLICFIAVTTILLFSVIAFLYFRFLYHPDREDRSAGSSKGGGGGGGSSSKRKKRTRQVGDGSDVRDYVYNAAQPAAEPCLSTLRRCASEPKKVMRVEADLNSHRPVRSELSRECELNIEAPSSEPGESVDGRMYDEHLPVYRSPLDPACIGMHVHEYDVEYASSIRTVSSGNRLRPSVSLEELENNNNTLAIAHEQASPNDSLPIDEPTAARLFSTQPTRRRSRTPSPSCPRAAKANMSRFQPNRLTTSAAECDFQPKSVSASNANTSDYSCSYVHESDTRTFNVAQNTLNCSHEHAAGNRTLVQRPFTDRFANATVGRKANTSKGGNDISKKYVSSFEGPSSFV